ncbi:hypothetical protein Lser_V15G37318 [Lactuca serriola]
MSNSKEIYESITTKTIVAEINLSCNDEQIDSISLTSEDLQNTIRIEAESSNSTNESYCSNIIEESEYKPDVPTEFVPVVNNVFKSLNLAVKMYNDYAEMSDYKVKKFFELHNHPLESIEERPYTKKARKMSYFEKEFVVHASKAKMGPTMAHKIRAVLKGGYEYVRVKVTDYKNLRRGVNIILCYKDAQIMINKMNDRRDHYPNYSFEFLRDGDMLAVMFWADEREVISFDAEFREVISFDALQKYKMVFVLFTTVDHHKKSVTVGAGLLSRETTESYEWLINAFLSAHKGKAPKVILTDQDPTIKQAVESVLPNSRHRLCMWHIMRKLQANVTDDLLKNKDFKKRFNKLVWNMHIKPDEFEKKWELIINEFNLEDKRWFNDMFELHDKWIHAYFSDTRMSALMKITSRSESMNSFFNTYSQFGNLLLHFMMNYETSIQKQRNTQKELDHLTKKKNRTNLEEVGKLMGISISKDIDINVPNVQSNKGSGKKNRIQSATEITYKNSNKQTRRCSGCGERAPHNLCTCPIKLTAKQSSKAT